MPLKVLFSNIGYAKGISGSLRDHILLFHRHVYCRPTVQTAALSELKKLIEEHKPDICCIVEVDKGSFHCAYLDQLSFLISDKYSHSDIADKYGEKSWLARMPLHGGRSNAFLARQYFPFEKFFFTHGTKRLIYRIEVAEDLHLFFTHFSLKKDVRKKQFREIRQLIKQTPGEVILLGDFNIMGGFSELQPLLKNKALTLLNPDDIHTFTFHKRKMILDLCLCSKNIAKAASLEIIPQKFSDHAALLAEFNF